MILATLKLFSFQNSDDAKIALFVFTNHRLFITIDIKA